MTHVFYQTEEPFSSQLMFDLVNDIPSYPQFVPDCVDAGILKQQDNLIMAFIEVDKLGFRKKFTTLNRLASPHSIEMTLIDGPFKKLEGIWRFVALDENRCNISFDLTFEFKNKILDLTVTPLFKDIMQNMVKAFSHRAKQVYK